MRFTKMHGLGNDFIVIAGESMIPDNVSELALKLCDRKHGIGADGLVFVLPSERNHFKMRVINASGYESNHYANAIRCVAKYVFDHRLIDEPEITIETLHAGVQTVFLTLEDAKVSTVRVDLGEPRFKELGVPTRLTFHDQTFRFTAVSVKDSFGVIYVDDVASVQMSDWARLFAAHPYFQQEENVVFVTVKSNIYAAVRVWERGCGLSWGAGTGAGAALVASAASGQMDRQATMSMKDGSLFVDWNEQDNRVYLTGSSEELYSGSI